jgi:hypothetical protein
LLALFYQLSVSGERKDSQCMLTVERKSKLVFC